MGEEVFFSFSFHFISFSSFPSPFFFLLRNYIKFHIQLYCTVPDIQMAVIALVLTCPG